MMGFQRLANVVSMVLNPFTNALPVFFVLLIRDAALTPGVLWAALAVSTIFAAIVPGAYVVTMKMRGMIKEWDVSNRQARLRPLAIGIASYVAGFILMDALGIGGLALGLMFCHATNTLLVLVITRWWKISIHAAGISGPLTVLQIAYGAAIWPWWSLLIGVGWARIALGKHTPAQVLAGATLGVVATALQITWFI